MGRTAIQKKENVDGWSWKFGPKIAWLLLFLLIPIAGCGKSEPAPDKPGELRILTDASIHPHLQSLFRSRAEEWNAPEAVWVSARPEELLAAAVAGQADLLIVAGKDTVQAVNRKCGELASSKAFAANAVELVAMKDRKIRLKKPKHLLQTRSERPGNSRFLRRLGAKVGRNPSRLEIRQTACPQTAPCRRFHGRPGKPSGGKGRGGLRISHRHHPRRRCGIPFPTAPTDPKPYSLPGRDSEKRSAARKGPENHGNSGEPRRVYSTFRRRISSSGSPGGPNGS